MLVKLDDYFKKEIDKADSYVGKSKRITLGDETYIDVEELLGIIEELNYELEHQIDVVRELDTALNNDYKPIRKEWEYGE